MLFKVRPNIPLPIQLRPKRSNFLKNYFYFYFYENKIQTFKSKNVQINKHLPMI